MLLHFIQYHTLAILDPRNVRTLDNAWGRYSFLAPEVCHDFRLCMQTLWYQVLEDDDDEVKDQKLKKIQVLKDEWARYCSVTESNVQSLEDIKVFWSYWCGKVMHAHHLAHATCHRGGPLAEAVTPYLWCLVTSAAVERSFSLAGLIDAKNRQKMGKGLREAAVAMYCNGDLEQRFSSLTL